jgi:hypothetical protein
MANKHGGYAEAAAQVIHNFHRMHQGAKGANGQPLDHHDITGMLLHSDHPSWFLQELGNMAHASGFSDIGNIAHRVAAAKRVLGV